MTTTPPSCQTAWLTAWQTACMAMIIGMLVFRVIMLWLSPLGLHGDEAQYWAWSKDLDWGYFSKPPMIAWVIAATTTLLGDAEWAVRLASPILHALTAAVIFQTARFLFDDKTGFWAAMIYMLMPAVWLSSGIVSTDVPLLLCWAVALNAWVHMRVRATGLRAIQLGLAIGLGVLSKYAMLFFLPVLMLAVLYDRPSRKGLNSVKGYMAGLIAGLVIVPNILWNINHDFVTFAHTTENANIQTGIPFHPLELLRFWGDQLAVFGPFTLVLLVLSIRAALRQKLDAPAFWLAAFVLSPLLIISLQALVSRANANWAVTGYVAGSILTAHYSVTYWPRLKRWLVGGISVQSVLCVIIGIGFIVPALGDALGLSNSVKRLRQWPETVAQLETRYQAGHEGRAYQSFAVDKRIIFYDLKYYGLENTGPLTMWLYHAQPRNHAEMTAPLPASVGPVLLINYHANYDNKFREDFARVEALPPLEIDLGGGKRRTLKLWAGYGYKPTQTR